MTRYQKVASVASVGALAGASAMAVAAAVESLPVLAVGSGVAILASLTGGTSILVGRRNRHKMESPSPSYDVQEAHEMESHGAVDHYTNR